MRPSAFGHPTIQRATRRDQYLRQSEDFEDRAGAFIDMAETLEAATPQKNAHRSDFIAVANRLRCDAADLRKQAHDFRTEAHRLEGIMEGAGG